MYVLLDKYDSAAVQDAITRYKKDVEATIARGRQSKRAVDTSQPRRETSRHFIARLDRVMANAPRHDNRPYNLFQKFFASIFLGQQFAAYEYIEQAGADIKHWYDKKHNPLKAISRNFIFYAIATVISAHEARNDLCCYFSPDLDGLTRLLARRLNGAVLRNSHYPPHYNVQPPMDMAQLSPGAANYLLQIIDRTRVAAIQDLVHLLLVFTAAWQLNNQPQMINCCQKLAEWVHVGAAISSIELDEEDELEEEGEEPEEVKRLNLVVETLEINVICHMMAAYGRHLLQMGQARKNLEIVADALDVFEDMLDAVVRHSQKTELHRIPKSQILLEFMQILATGGPRDRLGNTAHHIAAAYKALFFLEGLCIYQRPDLHLPNHEGDTILHFIAKHCSGQERWLHKFFGGSTFFTPNGSAILVILEGALLTFNPSEENSGLLRQQRLRHLTNHKARNPVLPIFALGKVFFEQSVAALHAHSYLFMGFPPDMLLQIALHCKKKIVPSQQPGMPPPRPYYVPDLEKLDILLSTLGLPIDAYVTDVIKNRNIQSNDKSTIFQWLIETGKLSPNTLVAGNPLFLHTLFHPTVTLLAALLRRNINFTGVRFWIPKLFVDSLLAENQRLQFLTLRIQENIKGPTPPKELGYVRPLMLAILVILSRHGFNPAVGQYIQKLINVLKPSGYDFTQERTYLEQNRHVTVLQQYNVIMAYAARARARAPAVTADADDDMVELSADSRRKLTEAPSFSAKLFRKYRRKNRLLSHKKLPAARDGSHYRLTRSPGTLISVQIPPPPPPRGDESDAIKFTFLS